MNQYMVINDENTQVLFEGGYVDCKMWMLANKYQIGYVSVVRYKDLKPCLYKSLIDLRHKGKI